MPTQRSSANALRDEYVPKTACKHGPSHPMLPCTTFAATAVQGATDTLVRAFACPDPGQRRRILCEVAGQLHSAERGCSRLFGRPMVDAALADVHLGSAVDAFLNHDFEASFGFWLMLDHPSSTTPWGTPYLAYRPGSPAPAKEILPAFVNKATERCTPEYLLSKLKTAVPCRCLEVEDPESELCGREDLFKDDPAWKPGVGAPGNGKLFDSYCRRCRGTGTKKHPLKKCSRCKMVAYCTEDCQVSDWDEHKKICGKQPEWWGTLRKAKNGPEDANGPGSSSSSG
ncbi:hypothetical protein DFJ74DRAFT_768986 [Hyaloraphidium curvatum]|nr:hypothetical protein DFJ74DRAFT_768986 [Hyaloraphidium curvatum]